MTLAFYYFSPANLSSFHLKVNFRVDCNHQVSKFLSDNCLCYSGAFAGNLKFGCFEFAADYVVGLFTGLLGHRFA